MPHPEIQRPQAVPVHLGDYLNKNQSLQVTEPNQTQATDDCQQQVGIDPSCLSVACKGLKDETPELGGVHTCKA